MEKRSFFLKNYAEVAGKSLRIDPRLRSAATSLLHNCNHLNIDYKYVAMTQSETKCKPAFIAVYSVIRTNR